MSSETHLVFVFYLADLTISNQYSKRNHSSKSIAIWVAVDSVGAALAGRT